MSSVPKIRPAVDSFMLWVDGAGGFFVVCQPTLFVGQAVDQSQVDVSILGDISRRHLKLSQVDDRHLVESLAPARLNGEPVEQALLSHGQRIRLANTSDSAQNGPSSGGREVELEYHRPHRVATTARIDVVSRHRTVPWSDAVIWLSDLLSLGSSSDCHIQCGDFEQTVDIVLRGGRLYCRSDQSFDIDGKSVENFRAMELYPIDLSSRISSETVTMSLERV